MRKGGDHAESKATAATRPASGHLRRVSGRSQAEEDKTSLSEQTIEMEAYCERKGLTITARYQEVGKGWSKKRLEFQRMLQTPSSGCSTPSSAGSPTA